MVAIGVSLVYRQVGYLAEIVRLLAQEGLLWVEPQKVSKQAVSQRLRTLPATLFIDLFSYEVVQGLSSEPYYRDAIIRLGLHHRKTSDRTAVFIVSRQIR
ncbi:MAG: hypothetical protein HC865_02510 [Cyanobacteria bacterium RU_5_0]|nr:hypothetical protein [Cyanobacteria bacterium RU_5_0]